MQTGNTSQTLDEEERQVAHDLWDTLMFAPHQTALEAARRDLKASPDRIQRALMNAIVMELAQCKSRARHENPFAPDAPPFSLNAFKPQPPHHDGVARDGVTDDGMARDGVAQVAASD